MTKAENRAAARAWHVERQQKLREEMRNAEIAKDLAALGRLRDYLIKESRTGGPRHELMDAIDDYAEAINGDRTALHARPSSIGPGKS